MVDGQKVSRNVSVTLIDDDVLPLPSTFAMRGPLTGPHTGGTILTLTPVVQPSAVYSANLVNGAEVLCRFTDVYGQALSVAGSVLPRGGQDSACRASSFSDILCPSPPRNLYADASLVCEVEVSVGGQPWVSANSSFLVFRWNAAELLADTLSGPAYGDTSLTITGVPAFIGMLTPRCKFGQEVVRAVFDDSTWVCISPNVTDALGDAGQRASNDPCSYNNYNASLYLDLNGQQFLDLGVSFVWFGNQAPCSHESLMPASGPITGGTRVSLMLLQNYRHPPHTLGAEWKCKFEDTISAVVIVSAMLLTTQGGHPYLRCKSPALPAVPFLDDGTALVTVSVSLNGKQWVPRVHEFTYYTAPVITSIESPISDFAIWPMVSLPTGGAAATVILRGSIAALQTVFIRLQAATDDTADGWVTLPGWRAPAGDAVSFAIAAPRIGDNSSTDARVLLALNGQQYVPSGSILSFYDPQRPPVIFSARPVSGSKDGGVLVRVAGENFAGVGSLTCRFGDRLVPAVFVSSRVATCIAPPNGPVGATGSGTVMLSVASFPSTGLWSEQEDRAITFRYTETSPAHCKASGSGLASRGLVAGVAATFTIYARTHLQARDSGGDQFYVDIFGGGRNQLTGIVVDLDREFYEGADDTSLQLYDSPSLEGGTYAVTWNATKAGAYTMLVTTSGANISGSPFSVVVEPAQLWPSMSSFEMATVNYTVGASLVVRLRLHDVWGNAVVRPADVSASCWLERLGVSVPLSSTDAPGRAGVLCTGSVQTAGLWQVVGIVDGHSVPPIAIYLAPGPSFSGQATVIFHCPNGTN